MNLHANIILKLLLLSTFSFYNSLCSDKITLTKCCDMNDGLIKIVNNNSFYYVCSSNFTEHIIPLRLKSDKIKNGIPKNCSDDNVCLDKLAETGNLVQLKCESEEIISNKSDPKITTIHKCCPDKMSYNDNTRSCSYNEKSKHNLIVDLKADLYNLIYGVSALCNTALVAYTIKEELKIINGKLELKSLDKNKQDLEILEEQFCVDPVGSSEYILRICEDQSICDKVTCISKCCPHGHMYRDTYGPIKCLPSWDVPFTPNFTDTDSQPDKMVFLPRKKCEGYVGDALNTYKIYSNGDIQIQKTLEIYKSYEYKYCLENFNTTTRKGYYPIICFPSEGETTGIKEFVYLAGLIISIIFLAITLTVYFFLTELQNLHGKTVMCHTASILASYICLAMVKLPVTKYITPICLTLGYGIMFTFLSAFAWLNVMCFDIWWTFGVVKVRGLHNRSELKKFLLYVLYAYGFPLVVTGITLFADLYKDFPEQFKPNIAGTSCWFHLTDGATLVYTIYFCIPVGLIIFCNIIFFALTARHCIKVKADIQRMKNIDSKKKKFTSDLSIFTMNLKLFIIMGITWIFEIVNVYIKEPVVVWYILDCLNVLQGLWIFCVFVLKRNVLKSMRNKIQNRPVRRNISQTQTTSFSGKNSVSSTTNLKVNSIHRPEEINLIQQNISHFPNNKENNEDKPINNQVAFTNL